MKHDVYIRSVETNMEGNACPRCGRTAEGGTAFDIDEKPSRQPRPGDFAVCLYCGAINAYRDDLKLRPITETEHQYIRRDPRLKEVLRYAELAAKSARRQWH